jgi:tRNA pseudouridine32 synthase/23S rRNA pseudouridine746 synthase
MPIPPQNAHLVIRVLFQGEDFVVIDKPSGLLSVRGRFADEDPVKADCVASRIEEMFPEATGSITPHRLDMDTSGVMILGLTKLAHRHLSIQFQDRLAQKAYIAMVAGHLPMDKERLIDLPMRLDVDNRPFQIVDHKQGRPAQTRARVLSHEEVLGQPASRVRFEPITGRSHQLRVHAAHADGLNAPILGDRLYGEESSGPRLMLHARELTIAVPAPKGEEGERMFFEAGEPF